MALQILFWWMVPAGLGNEAISAIKASDEIIIVTNPELPSVSDALKTIKLAEGEQFIGPHKVEIKKVESLELAQAA